jgi:hypothetical protein
MPFDLPLKDWTECLTDDLEPALRIACGEVYWQYPSAGGLPSHSTSDPCWCGDSITSIRLVRDTELTCRKAD